MFDPRFNLKRYLTWTFIMIVFLLASGIAVAKDENFYSKILPIDPEEVNGQYCFIKVTIKQKGDEIIKEEVMECADGKRKADGLGYWDLFAQFYYHNTTNMPQYCRYYSRPGHAFKSYGTTCLQPNGTWEVQ
tara:strand:+ start:1504 stop:1899 length:396 start_codon:yes stop_codon:yes gene_type:complete